LARRVVSRPVGQILGMAPPPGLALYLDFRERPFFNFSAHPETFFSDGMRHGAFTILMPLNRHEVNGKLAQPASPKGS